MADTQRLETLDLLRGIAVLGILVVNAQLFALPATSLHTPTLLDDFQGAEFLVWLVSHVFFEGKFVALFAALFGAGVVLLATRTEARGGDAALAHRNRMFALALLGLAHGTLVWMGDILLIYAVAGSLVFVAWRASPWRLLGWGLAVYSVPILVSLLVGWGIKLAPTTGYVALASAPLPLHEKVQGAIEAYQGGWLQQMEYRLPEALARYVLGIPAKLGWFVIGCMLLGMAAYKSGFLTGAWSSRAYGIAAVLGFGLGVPLSALGVIYREEHNWELLSGLLIGARLNEVAVPFVAVGWVAVLLLLHRRGFLQRLSWPLQAVGRTALSCYLLQSVVFTTIFYGHGLGLYGELGRPVQLLFVLACWALLLILAPAWLRWAGTGPAEWALREATRRRLGSRTHAHALLAWQGLTRLLRSVSPRAPLRLPSAPRLRPGR